MAKYKVGDKVRVRSDLKEDKWYSMEDDSHSNVVTGSMAKLRGEIVTIIKIEDGQYRIEGSSYVKWTDRMFEGLAEDAKPTSKYPRPKFKIGDKVKLRQGLYEHKRYGGLTLLRDMKSNEGRVMTIKRVDDDGYYDLEESGYTYSEQMLEFADASKNTTKKEIKLEDINMKFAIKSYKVIGNKVVIVEFADGDIQKSVCMDGDVFDEERGLEVCIMKHILGGKDKYHKVLKEASKQIVALDEKAKKDKADKEKAAQKKAKIVKEKAARKAKKRAENIADMTEAFTNALKANGGDVNVTEVSESVFSKFFNAFKN